MEQDFLVGHCDHDFLYNIIESWKTIFIFDWWFIFFDKCIIICPKCKNVYKIERNEIMIQVLNHDMHGPNS